MESHATWCDTRNVLRRLRRHAFPIFAIVCAIAASAIAASWYLSSNTLTRTNLLSWRFHGTRYTLRAANGNIQLAAPRPSPPPATNPAAPRIARLTNRQLCWTALTVRRKSNELLSFHALPGPYVAPTGQPEDLGQLILAPDAERPLIEALEDPDRFAVAHLLLTYRQRRSTRDRPAWTEPGTLVTYYNGLEARLRVTPPDFPAKSDRPVTLIQVVVPPAGASIDPAQLPAIRERWHDQLDARLAACPHWLVLAPLLIAPALWCARTWAAWRRRSRPGLCPACGYDLRATPDRCPECGTPAAPACASAPA